MLPANPNSPYKRKRPRPVNPLDNASTTGLAINVPGSYVSSSNALYGGQGTYGSGLPTVQLQAGKNEFQNWWNSITSGIGRNVQGGGMNVDLNNPGRNVQGGAIQMPTTATPGRNVPGGWTYQQRPDQNVLNTTNTNVTPMGTFSPERAQAEVLNRLEQGDLSMLQQIPKADLDAMGLTEVANTVNQVKQKSGAAPFGTDAQGNRLDAYGNIWDPSTAQTDIYGKRFTGPGTANYPVRQNARKKYWVNKKLQKQQKLASAQTAPVEEQTTGGFTGSYGVVNFNTGSG